ncbi:MAG: DUF4040 domain-containing protein [Firmicutes bacterium]|nr:DUF4040 domain-containing protein [Bacillota bacterium]MBQ9972504.1 DUF4040 domain-containing protein [Bacillota bacterium]
MQVLALEAVILLMLIFVTIAIIMTRDLLAAIVMFSAFSFLAVLGYFMMGAPDVAFTEAVIGTVSTIFLVAALRKIDRWCKK